MTAKAKRNPALAKHIEALKNTSFQKCATCPGTSGKVEEGNMMKCSRAGAVPVMVTPAQAQSCNGSKPTISAQKEHKLHFLPIRSMQTAFSR